MVNIVLTSSKADNIKEVKKKICKEFKTKDLGLLKYFLGIEVYQSKYEIVLSQKKYVLDLLKDIWIMGCRPADTHMDVNIKLCASFGEDVDIYKYHRLVGKLFYLTVTKHDILYIVSVVSQYIHIPQLTNWQALKRIFRYLKRAPEKGLLYQKNNHFNIEDFADADWVGSPNDRKSTSGYYTLVGGNLVTWRRASMELHCDNRASIHMASNSVADILTKPVTSKIQTTIYGKQVIYDILSIAA
ncbi:uncharacterized mitochondrial protein AtMg00810-like [Aristolochia californica]|uniref:uncharacterized mitochondrial protein AtMg00810-like n=1 Tax=Aristolochia californica TaxID=171875 RepID=UPI0035DC60DB